MFLDEIGEIPLHVQAKLLKFLEDSTIQSVGSPLSKTVQVQVIAATNKDLRHLVSTGEFRADLYYRLAVLPVEIPPLRQHRDDLPFLIDILLSRINGDREPSLSLSAGCRKRLMSYDFPGNIRELVNIFERLAVLADDEAQEHHLPAELLEPARPQDRMKQGAWTVKRKKTQSKTSSSRCSSSNGRSSSRPWMCAVANARLRSIWASTSAR